MLHTLNFITYQYNILDGYGLYAIETVEELIRLGYPVTPLQLPAVRFDWKYLPDNLKAHGRYDWSGLTVQLLPGNEFHRYQGRQWGYTMWEDDSIPRHWPDAIHQAVERVIVPCAFYADVFADAGVKVPIHVVPGGTNTDRFLPLPDRSGDRPFTFLVLADRGLRKGLEVVLNALRTSYWLARRDVRLLVKSRPGAGGQNMSIVKLIEPRAVFWEQDVPDMQQVYAEADCYVYTGYGDGWGLTPRQSVACGVPTIAPRHTGVQVGIDQWATCVLETFTRPFSNYAHDQARWFKPDPEETAEAMRWIYENYQEARRRALCGREWITHHQSWKHSAAALSGLIERYT